MTVAPRPTDSLNPQGIISHAQYARERDMKAKTFTGLRNEFPDRFPKAIRRGNWWYATRAEFDTFLDSLRGTCSPGIAARAAQAPATTEGD